MVNMRTLTILLCLGASSLAFAGAPTSFAHAEEQGGTLLETLRESQVGPAGLVWAALVAFALGALHALGPGHGKSVAVAYLVGARATSWHAVMLGAVLTAAHVGSVLALGGVALWATERFVPERVIMILEVVAGLSILTLGFALLWSRIRRARHAPDHDHVHAHAQDSTQEHAHGHERGHVHEHGHSHAAPSAGAILTLGMTAGMVPCPAAVVVLLAAIAVGRLTLGLGLIVIFSLGLAAVLVGLGVLVVRARSWVERFDAHGRVARFAPIASAALVTLLGAALTAESLLH